MFLFTGGQSGDSVPVLSYEQAESLRTTNSHKIYNNNLGVSTLPMNQYIVHKANFLLLEVLNLYFLFRM